MRRVEAANPCLTVGAPNLVPEESYRTAPIIQHAPDGGSRCPAATAPLERPGLQKLLYDDFVDVLSGQLRMFPGGADNRESLTLVSCQRGRVVGPDKRKDLLVALLAGSFEGSLKQPSRDALTPVIRRHIRRQGSDMIKGAGVVGEGFEALEATRKMPRPGSDSMYSRSCSTVNGVSKTVWLPASMIGLKMATICSASSGWASRIRSSISLTVTVCLRSRSRYDPKALRVRSGG